MGNQVSILIIDDDEQSQTALGHVLASEGWTVRIVPLANRALAELAGGDYALVLVNVTLTGLDGPLFTTLRELALAPPLDGNKRRARVLFLVPELAGAEAQPVLERDHLPYTLKPFHLHDFLEKVSDLLLETGTITTPIRRVRWEFKGPERRRKERRSGLDSRQTAMFASREDYMMTEEELAEFERQEEEARKKKKKQPWER